MEILNQAAILNREILISTESIRLNFPEYYDHLNETPLFLNYAKKAIELKDLEEYFESITLQAAIFGKN